MSIEVCKREKDGKKTPTRVFSSKQEQKVAKAVNGNITPNSGATDWSKGDVLTTDWLIECKTKTSHSNSISIKKEWFDKNNQERAFQGKQYSAIAFNFGPDEENYYIIDEYLFQDLIKYLKSC